MCHVARAPSPAFRPQHASQTVYPQVFFEATRIM